MHRENIYAEAVDPTHYKDHPSGFECVELKECLPPELADAVKYPWRCGQKDEELQELEKSRFYLDRFLTNCEEYSGWFKSAKKIRDKRFKIKQFDIDAVWDKLDMDKSDLGQVVKLITCFMLKSDIEKALTILELAIEARKELKNPEKHLISEDC